MSEAARSIDEVLEELDRIIDVSRRSNSRLGYFPAMYRHVTGEVERRAGASGFFDDDERMRQMVVIFANRYLAAYNEFQAGRSVPDSWQLAFEAAERYWPIVLQHLLLGMNAHINLDLALAAVETAGDALADLEHDFIRINDVLGENIDHIQVRLARIWPMLKLLDRVAGGNDEAVMNFSLRKARSCAWQEALDLARLKDEQRAAHIVSLDRRVALLGRAILHPGIATSAVNKAIRLGEKQNVADVIDLLLSKK